MPTREEFLCFLQQKPIGDGTPSYLYRDTTRALDEDELRETRDETLPDEEGMNRPGVVKAKSIYGDDSGEEIADILLWRNEKNTFVSFVVLNLLYYWFFSSGSTFTSSAAQLLFVLAVALYGLSFVPSKIFGFLQVKKIPPWRFEISESAVRDLSKDIVAAWNHGVHSLNSLSRGGDWIKFFKGFDIEGIVGPKGMVTSGQLVSYKCEGLRCCCYPFRQKVTCYGKLGLHRYNLIQGTSFELQDLIKFNMRYCGASTFYITLEARDTVTRGPLQIFQVCAEEKDFGYLNVVCSVARIKGGETTGGASETTGGASETTDRSELLSTHWILLYLELVLCIEYGYGNFSEVTFRGLAIDGTDESVERKAVIKSMFNELTGSLALQGTLCNGETPISAEEYFKFGNGSFEILVLDVRSMSCGSFDPCTDLLILVVETVRFLPQIGRSMTPRSTGLRQSTRKFKAYFNKSPP
ncbi:hypothetical protein F2Q68_00023911 [Brassica cretica]|uniref:Reticulon domain-containing protein n=1 Tax=Brassica cretica TaxID=69181 RepID=A0A8S9IHL4_BRACR|nr:hypothetical protein F2Q68_00023911 [Brassica cretica]